MAWSRSDGPGDETTPHRLPPLVRRGLLIGLVLLLAAVCGSVSVKLLRAATVSASAPAKPAGAPAKPVGGTSTPPAPASTPARPDNVTGLPAPTALAPLSGGPAVPWLTAVVSHNQPAVRFASLGSAGVLWIDPTFVRGQLRPGVGEPSGPWQAATWLSPFEQQVVAVAFNAGFRLPRDASRGGYYSEGRTAVPLRDNAASLVLHTDGTAGVGSWNNEVGMTADVASVRQNLVMLVDGGTVNPTCATGGLAEWGATLGGAAYIDRSGFGVTATGAEVYVGGSALSVCALGRILQEAGVVRGMELDINPMWITGVYYRIQPGAQPLGFRIYPAQRPSPSHYLSPSSRDWYAWFLRP
ncbi:MAG TPA: hypothetical protein VGL06_03375 [Pseudonocardiaceae bacterium]